MKNPNNIIIVFAVFVVFSEYSKYLAQKRLTHPRQCAIIIQEDVLSARALSIIHLIYKCNILPKEAMLYD